MARQCLEAGGNACAVFQGANEIAVEKFLAEKIKFTQIADIISKTLDAYSGEKDGTIEDCIASVNRARIIAEKFASKI
jgi:1-deoxy-D-xylulose-5-phosphate reductoisomerase